MPYAGYNAPTAQPKKQAAQTPGFVNFSRILDANRPGAQRMADQLAGQVQQQGDKVEKDIAGAEQTFGQQVQQGTNTYNGGMGPGSANATGDQFRAAGAAAAGAAVGYKGPKDWKGAGINTEALSTGAVQAGDAARQLTSAGGRAALLGQGRAGPYGAGMSALDSALSGAALGGRAQQLATQYGGLSDKLAQAQRAGGQQVEQAVTASGKADELYQQNARELEELARIQDLLMQPMPARPKYALGPGGARQENNDRVRAENEAIFRARGGRP
jgi:hypothetical protein